MPGVDLSQIDVLVAEHIFGWRHVTGDAVPDYARHLYPPIGKDQDVWLTDTAQGYRCQLCGDGVPGYSSDIATAWQVVEHLAKLGHGVEVRRWGEDYAECCVWERMQPDRIEEFTGKEWRALNASAPVAICLAALKTKGVEVPNGDHPTADC